MNSTVAPEPTSKQAEEQIRLMARLRRMMMIAGVTTSVAIAVLLVAIGYRLFRAEGSGASGPDITAVLPKGARILSTATAGDRLAVTLDVAGATEIRTFDAKTLKSTGRLRFAVEP
jgi:hypothetical protein